MEIGSWKFACTKRQPLKLFIYIISIYFEIMEFKLNDIKIFVNTLCYDNVHNCDFYRL
jgi:hypothetical protein